LIASKTLGIIRKVIRVFLFKGGMEDPSGFTENKELQINKLE
jgi:hypothetical protein